MYTQKKTTSFPSQDIFKMPTWMWLATSNGALPFNLERPQVQHWNSLKVKFPPKFLSSCRSIKTLTFQESLGFRKKKYMEEVRCETSWVCTTLTSVAGWDTLWHSALKHSCSCVEDQLPEWHGGGFAMPHWPQLKIHDPYFSVVIIIQMYIMCYLPLSITIYLQSQYTRKSRKAI